jgi:hypothetical protein
MSLVLTLAESPAVAALRENGARLADVIEHQVRTTEPSTWMLMVLACGLLWRFAVRPPQ